MYIRSLSNKNMEKQQDKRFEMPVYHKDNLIDFTNRNICIDTEPPSYDKNQLICFRNNGIWLGQIEGHGTRITSNPVAFCINCIGHGINSIKQFIMGKPKRINPNITGYALDLITHFPNIEQHDKELLKTFLIPKHDLSTTTFEEAYKEALILDKQ